MTACTSKAVVIVQCGTDFGGITQPNCTSNSVVISDSAAACDTGSASLVVLVTVCDPRTLHIAIRTETTLGCSCADTATVPAKLLSTKRCRNPFADDLRHKPLLFDYFI